MHARFLVPAVMVLVAAASRLIPHPPNFAPIAAMALFGGAYFTQARWAFLVPLAAMLLSDWFLAFHSATEFVHRTMPFVYGAFALTVCIGLWLRAHRGVLPIAGATLASSVLFFIVTNFGVWGVGTMYPHDLEGLWTCYVMAIPFFQNGLAGDMVYATVLFGGFALAQRWVPILGESRLTAQSC